ncbi:penicillin-binding transpeptidase domain-containing protein [Corynebacterium macclintockiae]|uniref:penicillin-binding transpeptidase domain-containing protein n=1 Tax=Corynebacterium macclintockiae TaxID=2913501 RepID=UPI003EB74828
MRTPTFSLSSATRRSITAAVTTAGLVLGAAACTPKPDVADDAAQAFLSALSTPGEASVAGGETDNPDKASQAIDQVWKSLQAEGLRTELKNVNSKDNQATAQYSMHWQLPGGRDFSYDSSMSLTRTGDDWSVRWQPAVLHPELGANQHLELRSVPAPVANVVGSDGAVLLKPGTQYRILVDTKKAASVLGTMRRIAGELDALRAGDKSVPAINPEKKAEEADGVDGEYSVVSVNQAQGKRLQEVLGNVEGVRMNEEPALVRPDPSFAPDIMSRVSSVVEKDLQGVNGWKVVAATNEGNEVAQVGGEEAKSAPSVRVSLSRKVQEAAQKAVNTRADSKVMMVVMRPSTGEVLAVAQSEKADEDGNTALMGQYPPGSTFKMLTAYAGLQKQGLTPDSIVDCPGTQDIGGRVVTNYNGFSLGSTPLENAFAKSCNTTFADISTKLKPGELKDVAAQFGLGADYDIEGLETITGSVPEGETMLDRTEAGYGQGLDLASPFGIALVASAVAAGKVPTPYLIAGDNHHTEANNDEAKKDAKKKLDPKIIQELRRMMRAVVTNGSGSGVAGAGEVYAKTGEAEINEGSHSWLAGYRGDLAFATLIVLGGGSEHATAVTADFFKNLDGPGAEAEGRQE